MGQEKFDEDLVKLLWPSLENLNFTDLQRVHYHNESKKATKHAKLSWPS